MGGKSTQSGLPLHFVCRDLGISYLKPAYAPLQQADEIGIVKLRRALCIKEAGDRQGGKKYDSDQLLF